MPRINKSKSTRTKPRRKSGKSGLLKRKNFFDPDKILLLFKRLGWGILVIGGIFWLGSWFFLSGASERLASWSYSKIDKVAINSGLSIKNILIEGRYYTDARTLKKVINLEKGDSLLSVDPDAVQQELVSLPWVKQAFIKKRWPDTLSITLVERVPMALYQKNKEIYLLDKNGEIIQERDLLPYKDLIIVSGERAPQNAPKLFSMLTVNKELYYEIERASLISGRRWDVILKNETVVKLPENDLAFALKILEDANKQDSILSKNLEIIDIRDPNRIVVKTRPGQLQNYSLSSNGEGSNI